MRTSVLSTANLKRTSGTIRSTCIVSNDDGTTVDARRLSHARRTRCSTSPDELSAQRMRVHTLASFTSAANVASYRVQCARNVLISQKSFCVTRNRFVLQRIQHLIRLFHTSTNGGIFIETTGSI